MTRTFCASVLTTIAEAESVAQQWARLPAGGASAIYTSPAWCLAAWRHFPDLGTPFLVTALDAAGSLIGLLPLSARDGKLQWAGSPLGDEHDARVHGDHSAAEVIPALVRAAMGALSARSVCCLPDTRPEGALGSTLPGDTGCPAPVLQLRDADPGVGALGCIPGWRHQRRRDLLRCSRRLQESGAFTVEIIDIPDVLVTALPSFVQARLAAWAHRGRTDELPAMDRHPGLAGFLADAGAALAASGSCFLAALCVDGVRVAQGLFFRTPEAQLWYMSTFRPEAARYSPSHLLLAEVASRAVAAGTRIMELGRGDEPYKFGLGARQRHLRDVRLAA